MSAAQPLANPHYQDLQQTLRKLHLDELKLDLEVEKLQVRRCRIGCVRMQERGGGGGGRQLVLGSGGMGQVGRAWGGRGQLAKGG